VDSYEGANNGRQWRQSLTARPELDFNNFLLAGQNSLVSWHQTCSALARPTKTIMTLDEASFSIRACVDQMNARYTKTVFDEWAVVSFNEKPARIFHYSGPRKEDFQKNFASDLDALRAGLLGSNYSIGDFEFARHGVGTKFEAFMVLGAGIYLICNNTRCSMDEIAKDSRWLGAQIPFVELSDKIRAHPVVPTA
jgi:hypothetical protein